jgi:hypothetical protein
LAVRSINPMVPTRQPLPSRQVGARDIRTSAWHLDVSSILTRVPLLWRLRSQARGLFFAVLRHLATLGDSRDLFAELLRRQHVLPPPPELSAHGQLAAPYPELRRVRRADRICRRPDVIFVTGRFRSGSTLVWNLFRNLPAFTAYYEPFNERRWFDPRTRGAHVDPSHVNVSNYWAEYDGLDALERYFSTQWKFQQLYMPAHAWNPAMQRYIETLIEKAPGRPVLQFNEMDLRLPWLRARFPGAKILHIFRHPRDQWCSTLGGDLASSASHTLRQFAAADGFYLLRWGADLRRYFPFLTLEERSHPYELFYQIWKLSYLFGRVHADVSIAFESLVQSPEPALRSIFGSLAIPERTLSTLLPLVRQVPLGKWRSYAAGEWFEAIETRVEQTFEEYAACVNQSAASLGKQHTIS